MGQMWGQEREDPAEPPGDDAPFPVGFTEAPESSDAERQTAEGRTGLGRGQSQSGGGVTATQQWGALSPPDCTPRSSHSSESCVVCTKVFRRDALWSAGNNTNLTAKSWLVETPGGNKAATVL